MRRLAYRGLDSLRLHDPLGCLPDDGVIALDKALDCLQQFAVQLNHNTLSTLALAQEVFSEEKYALLTRLAQ